MSTAPNNTPKTAIQMKIGPADVGMRGFLAWVNAAFTGKLAPVRAAVLARAKQLQAQGMAGLGQTLSPINVTASLQSTGGSASGNTTVASTSTAPATSSWASDLSGVIQAAASAYTTASELSTVNKITNINLQRAQAGQAPIPTNLSSYGVQGLGVNLGLSSGVQNILMYGGGALLLILGLGMVMKRR